MDLVAYIDVHNFVSIDLFESVGFVFEELDKQEEFGRYILKI